MIRCNIKRRVGEACVVVLISTVAACSHSASEGGAEAVDGDTVTPQEDLQRYHADNDIAMTVASVADAIRVGEPLDSADYDFEGILTDGEGRPLYTTEIGAPGEWDVDVLSPTTVEITNKAPGDLLPEELEEYLAQALQRSLAANSDTLRKLESKSERFKKEPAKFKHNAAPHHAENQNETIYGFGGGILRIITQTSDSIGPLVKIRIEK